MIFPCWHHLPTLSRNHGKHFLRNLTFMLVRGVAQLLQRPGACAHPRLSGQCPEPSSGPGLPAWDHSLYPCGSEQLGLALCGCWGGFSIFSWVQTPCKAGAGDPHMYLVFWRGRGTRCPLEHWCRSRAGDGDSAATDGSRSLINAQVHD